VLILWDKIMDWRKNAKGKGKKVLGLTPVSMPAAFLGF
jgi:hypothetical protein